MLPACPEGKGPAGVAGRTATPLMVLSPYIISYLVGPISGASTGATIRSLDLIDLCMNIHAAAGRTVINIPRKGKEYLSSFNEWGVRSV